MLYRVWFVDYGCHFCDLRLNSVYGLIIIDCFGLSTNIYQWIEELRVSTFMKSFFVHR